jgi:FtsZ-binding cell division protein ZapB
MDNQNPQTPAKKSNVIYFLIVVVLALLGTNAYLYFQKNKSDEKLVYQINDDNKVLVNTQTTLKASLDSLTSQLDSANSGKHRVSQALQAKDEQLKAKIRQLRKALANGNLTEKELRSAQEDIKQLRYFVTKYTTDIEELKQQNASLTTERDTLRTKTTTLQQQNQDLNSKVQTAAAIKSSSIAITAYKVKNSGKEVDVTRASTAKKIKINFTVATNDLAVKGLHDIYLRVIDPTGNLATSAATGNFTINGQDLQYTFKSAIDFKNDGSAYVIDWVNPAEFQKGTYSVLLYADGYQMGKSSFILK